MQLQFASTPPRARCAAGDEVELWPLDAALLAWLAIEGPTARGRLIALLWPETDATAARNALRQRLFKLRRQLGEEAVSGTAMLTLADGVSHDLFDADTAFEHAPPRPEGELARWFDAQRSTRRDHARGRLVAEIDAAEQRRDPATAAEVAQRLVALDPLREEGHRRLMRAHYLAGDRAAALQAFDACERLLKDEVGTRPDDDTLQLLRQIEGGERTATLQRTIALPATLLRTPRLVGRERELRRLRGAVDDASVVFCLGEGGSGKSRLLADLATAVTGEGTTCVVSASARAGDDAVAHALSARWLRAVLAEGAAPPSAAVDVLARLLPELGTPAAGRSDRDARLADGVVAWLDAAAASGLRAIVIDDLHHADAASVGLLRSVMGHARCGWIVAFRPAEAGTQVEQLLDEQTRSGRSALVSLQPLDGAGVTEFIESLGVPEWRDAALADALRQRTGGNPFYLLETLKALALEPGPKGSPRPGAATVWPRTEGLMRLVQTRIGRCSTLGQQVLRCAAIAGADLSVDLVATLLRLRPIELADAWQELQSAGLLDDAAFAHDLIAEAARGLVPAPVARSLHADAARFMEGVAGEPARIADHWLAAGEPPRAAPHLLEAAHRAIRAWQFAAAGALRQRASEILLAAGDRAGAFRALFAAFDDYTEVAAPVDFEALLERLDALADDDADRAGAGLARAAMLVESRRWAQCRPLLRATRQEAERLELHDLVAEAAWMEAAVLWDRRESAAAVEMAKRSLVSLDRVPSQRRRMLQREPVELRLKVLSALGVITGRAGDYANSETWLREAELLGRGRAGLGDITIVWGQARNAIEQGHARRAQRLLDGIFSRWRSSPSIVKDWRLIAHVFAPVQASLGNLGAALHLLSGLDDPAPGLPYDRNLVRHRIERHALEHELGRDDLAQRGLASLREQDDLVPGERVLVDALAVAVQRDATRSGDLVDRAAALDELALQARVLWLTSRHVDPDRVAPVLTMAAVSARERGAHGLWLTLQAARLAVLRRGGRSGDGVEIARACWAQIETGSVPTESFASIGVELALALGDADAALAGVIAMRSAAWMQHAASTLEEPWRSGFLRRAPALAVLPSRLPGLLQSGEAQSAVIDAQRAD